jgi:hypothetical protein
MSENNGRPWGDCFGTITLVGISFGIVGWLSARATERMQENKKWVEINRKLDGIMADLNYFDKKDVGPGKKITQPNFIERHDKQERIPN